VDLGRSYRKEFYWEKSRLSYAADEQGSRQGHFEHLHARAHTPADAECPRRRRARHILLPVGLHLVKTELSNLGFKSLGIFSDCCFVPLFPATLTRDVCYACLPFSCGKASSTNSRHLAYTLALRACTNSSCCLRSSAMGSCHRFAGIRRVEA